MTAAVGTIPLLFFLAAQARPAGGLSLLDAAPVAKADEARGTGWVLDTPRGPRDEAPETAPSVAVRLEAQQRELEDRLHIAEEHLANVEEVQRQVANRTASDQQVTGRLDRAEGRAWDAEARLRRLEEAADDERGARQRVEAYVNERHHASMDDDAPPPGGPPPGRREEEEEGGPPPPPDAPPPPVLPEVPPPLPGAAAPAPLPRAAEEAPSPPLFAWHLPPPSRGLPPPPPRALPRAALAPLPSLRGVGVGGGLDVGLPVATRSSFVVGQTVRVFSPTTGKHFSDGKVLTVAARPVHVNGIDYPKDSIFVEYNQAQWQKWVTPKELGAVVQALPTGAATTPAEEPAKTESDGDAMKNLVSRGEADKNTADNMKEEEEEKDRERKEEMQEQAEQPTLVVREMVDKKKEEKTGGDGDGGADAAFS